ncbi:hypothetical protein [Bradyrhizobium ottawaense]|nr:hypothetical protein [Bradyrhizobium ottawaense]
MQALIDADPPPATAARAWSRALIAYSSDGDQVFQTMVITDSR